MRKLEDIRCRGATRNVKADEKSIQDKTMSI